MKVHIVKPYDLEKNLGRAYNEAMARIPDGDWACLCDLDTSFLTPDAGTILHEYAANFPDAGILTAYTNRLHPLAADQLLDGRINENTCIKYHSERAYHQKRFGITVTEINHVISGFLMLVSKKTWNQIKFPESGKCLGVDNDYSAKILDARKKIYRMESLYVWHSYRLNDIKDKTHLL